jgi:hypothetical protein
MTFARWLFRIAGVYGLLVLPPQYLLEERISRDTPPAITHPEYFYGFLGVAIAWQVAFLIIGQDPVRYRLMMLPAVIEKVSFGIAAAVLYAQGRASGALLAFGGVDLVLGGLFLACFLMTGRKREGQA